MAKIKWELSDKKESLWASVPVKVGSINCVVYESDIHNSYAIIVWLYDSSIPFSIENEQVRKHGYQSIFEAMIEAESIIVEKYKESHPELVLR